MPQGRIRHHHFGEGDYEESEQVIQQLLAEAGQDRTCRQVVVVGRRHGRRGRRGRAATSRSPETYVGYERAENFVSPGGAVQDAPHVYARGARRGSTNGGSSGDWTIGGEHAVLDATDGSIVYRFHARDLHLVLGPAPDGKPVRFRVTIDGAAPGDSHGADIDADGNGVVTGQRLYQLVRQSGPIADRTFEIRVPRSRRAGLRIHLRLKLEMTHDPNAQEPHRAARLAALASRRLSPLALVLLAGIGDALRCHRAAEEARVPSRRPTVDETAPAPARPRRPRCSPAAASGACRACSSTSRA